MERKSFVFSTVTDRITIGSGVLIISFLTTISGVLMVFLQIRDTGSIDLHTPFIDGVVKSGFVGISLIFFGIVLAVFSLVAVSKRELEIKANDVCVRLKGSFSRKAIFEAIEAMSSIVHSSTDANASSERKTSK